MTSSKCRQWLKLGLYCQLAILPLNSHSQARDDFDENIYRESIKSEPIEILALAFAGNAGLLLESCALANGITAVTAVGDTLPVGSLLADLITLVIAGKFSYHKSDPGETWFFDFLGGAVDAVLTAVVYAGESVINAFGKLGILISNRDMTPWTDYSSSIEAANYLLSSSYVSTSDVAKTLYGNQSYCVVSWIKLAAINDETLRRALAQSKQ